MATAEKMHRAANANGTFPATRARVSPRNPYIRDERHNADRDSMITPGAELRSHVDRIAYDGHMPIAGRPTWPDAPAPRPPRQGLTFDLRFTVLRRDSPAWRMSRLAYGIARVACIRGTQVVTLHTDDRATSGLAVHLTGLDRSAPRHVAGTVALAHRGAELGDATPWSSALTPGSSCLQALPLRLGGVIYLMTRVAGPYDSLTETPLTQ